MTLARPARGKPQRLIPAVGQASFPEPIEEATLLRRQGIDTALPRIVPAGSADRPRARHSRCRQGSRREHTASQGTVGPHRPFPEDAGTVCRARPFDLGQPAADDRRAPDHRWPRIACGKQDCRGHDIDIVAVDLLHMPTGWQSARACRHSAPGRSPRRPSSGCRPRGKTSFPRRRCPASEMTSCPTPSWRQPSPTKA